jgi:hypothetical protein
MTWYQTPDPAMPKYVDVSHDQSQKRQQQNVYLEKTQRLAMDAEPI